MLIYCNQKLDSRKTKKTHNQANKQTNKKTSKPTKTNKQQKQQTNKQQISKQTKTKQITKTNKQQTNKQANKNNKNKQTTNKQANKNNKNKQTNNKQTKNKTIEVGPQFLNLCHSTFPSHCPPSQGLLIGSLQLSVVFSVGDSLGGSSSYCTLLSNVVKNNQMLSYFASFRRGIGNWWQVRLPTSWFHIATVFCNFNYIVKSFLNL